MKLLLASAPLTLAPVTLMPGSERHASRAVPAIEPEVIGHIMFRVAAGVRLPSPIPTFMIGRGDYLLTLAQASGR